ncbi:hypothetical protein F5Y02DRAFT_365506 [Annulohypoxylon stygium]|nr:hypothetical protein F5Y02DRAFT_365506 [Annulohypoxylon stygium]
MGGVQSVPVVGEVVTAVDAGGKSIAAGVCAIAGQDKAAQELLDGAKRSWDNYTDVNCIVSNARVLGAVIQGDDKERDRLLNAQKEAWTDVAEGTPVVGHAIGVYHYATGDSAAGDRTMISATRSTAVIAATVATGGAGAIACAGAAAATGLACDGVATGLNSLGQHKFAPTGTIAATAHAIVTGSADDIFNAAEGIAADGVAGALHGRVKGRVKLNLQDIPASELAEHPRTARPSLFENYKKFTEHPDASHIKQASMETVKSFAEINAIKEAASPRLAMRALEPGQCYDFVRLEDGRMRYISHADAAKISNATEMRVGHTSLVEPGTKIIAAGEIYLDNKGVITNLNPQSGHFRVPLEIFKKQVGQDFPRSPIMEMSSQAQQILNRLAPRSPRLLPKIKVIAVYTTSAILIIAEPNVDNQNLLKGGSLAVAYHDPDAVTLVAFEDGDLARTAYSDVTSTSKMLCKRTAVLRGQGETYRILENEGPVNNMIECLMHLGGLQNP